MMTQNDDLTREIFPQSRKYQVNCNKKRVGSWFCFIAGLLATSTGLAFYINERVQKGKACQITGTKCVEGDYFHQCLSNAITVLCGNKEIPKFEYGSNITLNRCGNVTDAIAPTDKEKPLNFNVRTVGIFGGPCEQSVQIEGGTYPYLPVTPFRRS